jgi:hypothetical protein
VQERIKVPALEDAVVNAALSLGSNGRGKGGVGGHMVAMASKHPKRFAPLLEMALRLKKSARPNEDCEWCGGEPQGNRVKNLCSDEASEEVVIPGGDFAAESEGILSPGSPD